jgi:hypothetical protein
MFITCFYLFFYSCSNTTKIEEVRDTVPFDEFEYLDRFNSNTILYRNTPKHLNLLKGKKVELRINHRTDLLENNYKKYKYNPTLNSWIKSDTIFILKTEYKKGSCIHFYPYLEETNRGYRLLSPEIIEGGADVEGSDTNMWRSLCELVTVVELLYKIPKSDIKNKQLFFEEKEIPTY